MMWFFLALVIPLIITIVYGLKFRNPYKLIMIFGKKGTGKTTLLCKLAYEYSRKGWTIFSTIPIPASILLSPSDIGFLKFPQNSLLLIDEVSLIWSNRDFKNFQKQVEKFFRYQRHKRIRCYLFSQSFDIDKKIRDLVDSMYLATIKFNCISWLKQISKSIALTEAESDRPSVIAENLRFEPLLLAPFGTRMFTFLPKWVGMFDSFEDDEKGLKEAPTVAEPPARPKSPAAVILDLFPIGNLLKSRRKERAKRTPDDEQQS